MLVLLPEIEIDPLRHLPRWIRRHGHLARLVESYWNPRVASELLAAIGSVSHWPSWAHLYPIPIRSRSVTLTEQATGRRVRVLFSSDPIGSLYRPAPFFIVTSRYTVFFQLGLVERRVEVSGSGGSPPFRVVPNPPAMPLERAFLQRGRRWLLVMPDREGGFSFEEEGAYTLRYLPAGELPVFLGPDGLPLQVVPLQYWQRSLAYLIGLTDTDRLPSALILEKLQRLAPDSPLFGIAGELELSERVEVEDGYLPKVWRATASYHEDHLPWNRVSSRGSSLSLPPGSEARTHLWLARDIGFEMPSHLVLPGLVAPASGFDATGKWAGVVSLSEWREWNPFLLSVLGYQLDVSATRVAPAWIFSVSDWDTVSDGVGYLPELRISPVSWSESSSESSQVLTFSWSGSWLDQWFHLWDSWPSRESVSGSAGWSQQWLTHWLSGWDGNIFSTGAEPDSPSMRWFLPLGDSGRLFGWGDNAFGALGEHSELGAGLPAHVPHRIGDISDLVDVSSSETHTLILTRNKLYACGSNRYGQWGNGTADGTDTQRLLTDITSWLPSGVLVSDIRQVVAGKHVSFLVLKDGRVYGAGGSEYGLLGLPSGGTTSQPVTSWTLIPSLNGVRRMVVTDLNAFAIQTSGALYVSGDNTFGQYGNGSIGSYPGWNATNLSEMGGAYRLVATGSPRPVVLAIDDRRFHVWGWGENSLRVLGVNQDVVTVPTRIDVSVAAPVRDIACGGHGAWAACLDRTGTPFAWGVTSSGIPCQRHEDRLLSGWVPPQQAVRLRCVDERGEARQVTACGQLPSEALWFISDGKLYVWGRRHSPFGAFPAGDDPVTLQLSAENVLHSSIPHNDSDGGEMGFLIDREGVLYAHGLNRFYATGNGQLTDYPHGWTPLSLSPSLQGRLRRVYSSGWSTFVVDDTGALYAAGSNSSGQLGLGSLFGQVVTEFVPVYALQGVPVESVVTVRNTHPSQPVGFTLVLTRDGALYSCGHNSQGQLGVGDTVSRPMLTFVAGNVVAASAIMTPSVAFSAYLTRDGKLYVMGNMVTGADGGGIGTVRYRLQPTLVTGVPQGDLRAFAITPGGGMMALDKDGFVWAWGIDRYGALGVGLGESAEVATPVRVYRVEPTKVSAFGAYAYGSYLLTEEGLLLSGIVPYGSRVADEMSSVLYDYSGYFSRVEIQDAVRLVSSEHALFVIDRRGRIYHIGQLPTSGYLGVPVRSVIQPIRFELYRRSE